MSWLDDPLRPGRYYWERDDADPVTELLPTIPPPPPLPHRVPGATLRRPPPVPAEPWAGPPTEPGPIPRLDPILPPLTSSYDTADELSPTEENPVNLRREPAILWISLVAPIVQAIAAFVFVTNPDTQAVVNAAAVAVAGAITAWLVRADNLLPALTGAAQAVIALTIGLGADWTPEQQAALMVPVGIIAGYVVRDRVVAPIPAVDTTTRLAA